MQVTEYGKKPFLLRIKKLFKVKRGFIPLYISKGCFSGMKELLD